MSRDFTWRDAGRTIVLRRGALAAAPDLLEEQGFESFQLFSTARALPEVPELAAAAEAVHEVSSGQVPDLAAELLDVSGPAFVAFGGGRVVDVAKALAAVAGARVAAIPTTMSGAEMTAIHRLPAGAEDRVRGMVRPALVIADPDAMTSQPERQLRASSMNALAHGADTLYTPLSNPVSELTALRGAELIAAALDQPRPERDNADLALGSLLCGYAIDSAGLGLHHVISQTLVRVTGSSHAETNAAILPEAVAFLAAQAPEPYAKLAAALGTDPAGLAPRIRELGQPAGLGASGAERAKLDEAIEAMLRRSELTAVPTPPSHEQLAELIDRAW